jgi:hypothetical protein
MNEEVARELSTLVGDRNPLQVHAEAANTSRFGRLIARSRPIGTLVSSEGGTTLPGPGSVYLCRTLRFPAPVFLGDYENLMEAAQFMEMMDKRPGFKTACVQVIGWRNGWPTEREPSCLAKRVSKSGYGKYLRELAQRGDHA